VPRRTLDTISPEALCVTKGELSASHIEVPTFRAVAPGHAGDAAALRVRVSGRTEHMRALASGQERRQVGLKLRAQDGCNVVYVMWRLDPKPKLDVSVKRNPGARTAKECGADGYTKVKPMLPAKRLPDLVDGGDHTLRAEIQGSALVAWVDETEVWRGVLPASAEGLVGPAGVRSDNLAIELVSFSAELRDGDDVKLKCAGDAASD
jgi:hypothetical protein